MMHHKMNRVLGRVSVGIVCGLMTACAGGDTPARNSALEGFLSSEFGSGTAVGNTGGSGSGNGGSGNSGSGNNGGSTSGSGNNGGSDSGSGGSEAETGGTGGDDPGMGGSGGGGDCDGFQVLQQNCGMSGCHGTGSPYTPFAVSEADAADYAGEPAEGGCGSSGTSVFDPEDPSGSLVILKLGASPPCGGQMPPGRAGELDDQIDCIQEFISGL